MEPVTLFVLASLTAGAAATARTPWNAPRIEEKKSEISLVQAIPAPTNFLVAPALSAAPLMTLKDRLLKEVEQFSPTAPHSDPAIISHLDDIAAAKTILKALPAGLPLPTLMRNDDGQIGMYWDSDDAYADINIEPGQSFSFFSRSRSSGQERFIDSIPANTFTSEWAFHNLGLLVEEHLAAA
jgi:hypothetical protein